MAAIIKSNSQLADSSDNPLVGLRQSNVADPAAITAASITITYTTDDPGITPDNGITIADGDTISALETLTAIEELVAQLIKTNADVLAVRTQLAAALDVLEEHGLMTAS
jgi:hypothetical protein